MPDIPEPAIQAAAEVLFRQYESEYSADHLTWRDFADPAREVLEAAAPILADAVAAKILAHRDEHWPSGCVGNGPGRRHFSIAAQVAALAFSTRQDQLRMAAEALNRGDYMSCPSLERREDGERGTDL